MLCKNIKFSVIIPVYNAEEYLEKCLKSILAQTFEDYEIILVDDASKDSSGIIADKYARNYPDKIITLHQENKGPGGARNAGIKKSCGEFLVFVDSDDYLEKNAFEILNNYLQKYDIDVLKFGLNYEKASDYTIKSAPTDNISFKYIDKKEFIIDQPAAWRNVYRSYVFKQKNIEFSEHIYYEDLATIPLVALSAEKIGKIDCCLYNYIFNEKSIINGTKDIKKFLDTLTAFQRIIDYYKHENKFQYFYEELEWLAIQHILYYNSLRILSVNINRDALRKNLNFMSDNFPNFRESKYLQNMPYYFDKKLMNHLIKKQYFRAYAMTTLRIRIVNFIKGLLGYSKN